MTFGWFKSMGITRKIALSAGLLGILSGVVLGFVSLWFESAQRADTARVSADRMIHATLPQVAGAYWQVDVQAVRAILSGLLEDPTIVAVDIDDPLLSEELRKSSGLDGLAMQLPFVDALPVLSHVLRSDSQLAEEHRYPLLNPRDGAEIGQLLVTFSYHQVIDTMVARSFIVFGSSILQALFVTAVIFLVVQVTVIRPIARLQNAALRVRDGHHFELIGRDRRLFDLKRRDEIAKLARAFRRTVSELEDGRDNLQELVQDRTRELEDARNEALEASRAKSVFLANMSHELRTPLNAISGLSEVLMRNGQSGEMLRHLTDMRAAAAQLSENIDSVLDLSKIEAGQLVLEQVWIAVDDLLDDLVSQTRALMVDTTVRLRWDYAADLPDEIRADPLRIKQIVMNFASNAVKFTRHGEICIYARQDGENLVIGVRDTGIGIAAEQIEEIFKPFGQADSSTTREFGGTGLGLSIARRLADLMEGTLTVDSALGRGAQFELGIAVPSRANVLAMRPLETAVLGDGSCVGAVQVMAARIDFDPKVELENVTVRVDDTHVWFVRQGAGCDFQEKLTLPITHREFYESIKGLGLADDQSVISTSTLKGVEVLVVEDNRINLSVFVALIEKLGARVRTAQNGLQAIEQVAREMPSIILMDLHMPLMDGHRALQVLRAEHGDALVPVIAASANATPEAHERCSAAGFDDFLPKPVDPARLREVLERFAAVAEGAGHLDRELGLKYAGGDPVLYRRSLKRFARNLPQWKVALIDAQADDDQEALAKLLHIIKGVSGTVGAERLSELAWQGKLVEIVGEIESLRSELKETGIKTASVQKDLGRGDLAQLSELMKRHDMAALELMHRLAPQSGLESDWQLIVNALENLDFATAESVLPRLEARFHATW